MTDAAAQNILDAESARLENERKEREKQRLKWLQPTSIVIMFLAVAVPGVLWGVDTDPRRLFKGLALSAAIVAAVGAGVRLGAHQNSPAFDWFGKSLGLTSAFLAALTAGVAFNVFPG